MYLSEIFCHRAEIWIHDYHIPRHIFSKVHHEISTLSILTVVLSYISLISQCKGILSFKNAPDSDIQKANPPPKAFDAERLPVGYYNVPFLCALSLKKKRHN